MSLLLNVRPPPSAPATPPLPQSGGPPWADRIKDLFYYDLRGRKVFTEDPRDAERGMAAQEAREAGMTVMVPNVVVVISTPGIQVEVTVPHRHFVANKVEETDE